MVKIEVLSKENTQEINGGSWPLIAGGAYFIWNTGCTIGKDIANQNKKIKGEIV